MSPAFLPRCGFVAGCLFAAAAVFAQPIRYDDVLFENVEVTSDIAFRTTQNYKGESETLKLDIYQGAGDIHRNRAAIVWIHGGGFRPPNDKRQRYIVTMATEFARRGYVCVSLDYRVRAEQGPDRMPILRDAVEDCQAGLAWVRAHAKEYGIDANRIAIGGGSAGGMIAVSLAALENTGAAKARTPRLFALINLWGSPREDFVLAPVDEHYPPTVIVHGTADQSVPFAQSEALVRRLKANRLGYKLLALPDAPHTPTAHMEAIIKATTAFAAVALRQHFLSPLSTIGGRETGDRKPESGNTGAASPSDLHR